MKSLVFAIGRFNPPTKGHEEMIKKVVSVAKQETAPFIIFTTQTHDSKKNPLDINTKLAYLRMAFPGIPIVDVKNIIEAIQHVDNQGVNNVIVVAGIDRVNSFAELIQRGIDGNHFENIKSVSSVLLNRDADSETVTGASATKARKFAEDGNLNKFIEISPSKLNTKQAEQLYTSVRKGLGVQ